MTALQDCDKNVIFQTVTEDRAVWTVRPRGNSEVGREPS